MTALALLQIATAANACTGGEDPSSLAAALAEGDRALAVLDQPRFTEAVARAGAILGCLREPLPPALAAAMHRSEGVRAFGAREPQAATLAFAAARRLEPGVGLRPDLFPPGSPVAEVWQASAVDDRALERLPPPSTGTLWLDGRPTLERAPTLPTVFQWTSADGHQATSAYLRPGDPVPPYPTAEPRSERDHRLPLAGAAAATGASALALWGLSVHGRARYLDLDRPVPDERLDGLRSRTNALVVASITSAGLCSMSGALLAATW